MKNVLITGGAGFIGSTLVKKLKKEGYVVTVLDNLSEQIHGSNPSETSPIYQAIRDEVNFIHGSVSDLEKISEALKGQDIIVHFAAETGTGQSMYEIYKYSEININATALILDYLANNEHHVKKFIIASSRSIYGEGKYFCEELGIDVYPKHRSAESMDSGNFEVRFRNYPLELVATTEDSKIHPSSVYGITKQTQEQLVMTVCPSIGIEPVALRYQNVYGPGQSLSNPYTGILSIFSTLIFNDKGINIFEDGLESRDFVYVDDVIEATYLSMTRKEANGNIYNVGSGVPTTVLTVANLLVKNYKKEVNIKVTGNYRLGDIRHNYADISKISKDLGFAPKYSFEQGLVKFCNWVKEQSIEDDKYQQSIDEMKKKGLFRGN